MNHLELCYTYCELSSATLMHVCEYVCACVRVCGVHALYSGGGRSENDVLARGMRGLGAGRREARANRTGVAGCLILPQQRQRAPAWRIRHHRASYRPRGVGAAVIGTRAGASGSPAPSPHPAACPCGLGPLGEGGGDGDEDEDEGLALSTTPGPGPSSATS